MGLKNKEYTKAESLIYLKLYEKKLNYKVPELIYFTKKIITKIQIELLVILKKSLKIKRSLYVLLHFKRTTLKDQMQGNLNLLKIYRLIKIYSQDILT